MKEQAGVQKICICFFFLISSLGKLLILYLLTQSNLEFLICYLAYAIILAVTVYIFLR